MLSSFPLLVFARRHNFIVGTAMAAVEEPHRVDQFPQGSRLGTDGEGERMRFAGSNVLHICGDHSASEVDRVVVASTLSCIYGT